MGPGEAETRDQLVCLSVPCPVAQKSPDISFFIPSSDICIAVSMHYKFCYTEQSTTFPLASNSYCSFLLWVGVIINDNCNILKQPEKII